MQPADGPGSPGAHNVTASALTVHRAAATTIANRACRRVFRMLEAASHLRRPPRDLLVRGTVQSSRFVWLYATTVGELNAVSGWLDALMARLDGLQLVLITNHAHYAEAYLRRYPAAIVASFDGASSVASRLLALYPPLMVIVAEIPALPHDAPCRFSYATLLSAKEAGATTVLVNGWLYGEEPSSRIDRLERAWFTTDYLRQFDLMMVQSEQVREGLLAHGADKHRIHVTGNLKLDNLRLGLGRLPQSRLYDELSVYTSGPLLVAGSITGDDELQGLILSFKALLACRPTARMVIAPRHPENPEYMRSLKGRLDEADMAFTYRSACEPGSLLSQPILVLDTMGELSACYAACTWAYVSTDHNVLEPMAWNKIVFTSGSWKPRYPSYSLYKEAAHRGLVRHALRTAELAPAWVQLFNSFENDAQRQAEHIELLTSSEVGRAGPMVELTLAAFDRAHARNPA